MVESRHLTSSFDWFTCGILSILGHFCCVQLLPWPRSLPVESSPIAIDWIPLSENAVSQTTALPEALANIPLHSSDLITPVLPPSDRSSPPTAIVPQMPPLPTAPQSKLPKLPNLGGAPYSPPVESEREGLKVPLGDPLLPLPQESEEPLESQPLPSVPGIKATLPTTPVVPESDHLPGGANGSTETSPEINTEINVAANPNPLQFQVRVEVPPIDYSATPDYIPPQPHDTERILTADPLTRHCTVPTLEAVQTSGTPLRFEVTIDEAGHLTHATPEGSAGFYTDYQTWAACILQDWPFDPAQVQQAPVEASLSILIRIQVLSSGI